MEEGRSEGATRIAGHVLVLLLVGSAGGSAETVETGSSPAAEPKPVVTFEQRTRVEGLTNPFRLDRLGPTRVLAFRTRLQIALPKIAGPLGALVELQDSRSTWNDEPSSTTASQTSTPLPNCCRAWHRGSICLQPLSVAATWRP